MRTKQAQWFVTKVRYEQTQEDGFQKAVSENYCIDAVSFAEAETRIIEQMQSYISGGFEVKAVSLANFGEVVFSDDANADKWYKVKLQFITIDEKTEKEKRTNSNYLVQASSLNGAVKNTDEFMGGTMIDYNIASVQETNIEDVLEYQPKEQSSEEEVDE